MLFYLAKPKNKLNDKEQNYIKTFMYVLQIL
jgi:hypothetical protein